MREDDACEKSGPVPPITPMPQQRAQVAALLFLTEDDWAELGRVSTRHEELHLQHVGVMDNQGKAILSDY